MTECNCVLRRDGDDVSVCDVESDAGNYCCLPHGHDGAHVACSVAEHPVEVWEP